MTDEPYRLSPVDSDDAMEQSVLASVLIEHPAQLTMTDLLLERGDPDDAVERDAVDRAVRRLVGAGLVHLNGIFVAPTRAALRFEELASL